MACFCSQPYPISPCATAAGHFSTFALIGPPAATLRYSAFGITQLYCRRAYLASDLQIPSLVRKRLELQQKELRIREKRSKSCSSFGIQCYSSADSNILLQDNRVENLPCLVVHVDSRLEIIDVSRRGVLRNQKQLVNGIELDVVTGLNFAPI